MSNIITLGHLIPCVAVALAVSAAFTVISMPKLETAAVSTSDDQDAKAACLRTWPYYERACLHDSRQQDSNVHAVRVITMDGSARHRVSRQ
jgi:hypothetical protein